MTETADRIKGLYFPVLDHGFVALVDYMGDDSAIVQAARVSYGAGTKHLSEDRGLIRYLMRHRHTTPLEMVELKFHVKLPLFVARQLIRHRSASVNEYSLRYSLAPLQFYMPEYESFRKQSQTNRQGRGEAADRVAYDKIHGLMQRANDVASEAYVEALVEDIARELARLPLPVNLYTEWYWKIDLHNLFHFLSLRSDSHAQEEIQAYSNVKAGIVKHVVPLAFEAWVDYRFCARSFSRLELTALIQMLTTGKGASESSLGDLGLSKREIAEFIAKTSTVPEAPSFDLDLSTARTADYFYEKAAAAVPKLNRGV